MGSSSCGRESTCITAKQKKRQGGNNKKRMSRDENSSMREGGQGRKGAEQRSEMTHEKAENT